jgi:hypothetical protein
VELSEEVAAWVQRWREPGSKRNVGDAKALRARTAAWLKTEAAEKNKYLGKKRGDWFELFESAVARHQTGKKLVLAEESAWAVLCYERGFATELWLAAEGPAFCVRAWMGTWKYDPWGHCIPHPNGLFARSSHEEWSNLRDALCLVDDEGFAEASRIAKGDAVAYPITMKVALAFALGDGEWARELAPQWEAEAKAGTIPRDSDAFAWGLMSAASDVETVERLARSFAKRRTYSRASWEHMAATVLARLGDASLPALAMLLDRAIVQRDMPVAALAKVIACIGTLDAGRALGKHIEHKEIRPLLLAWVDAHPAEGVEALGEVARSSPKSADAANRALQQVRHRHPEIGGASMEPQLPEASPSELPALLVTPRWEGARKPKPRPIVPGLAVPERAERVVWKAGERERAKDSGIDWDLLQSWNEVPKGAARKSAKIDAHIEKKVAAAKSSDWSKRVHFIGTLLSGMSDKAALALWNGLEDIRKLDPSGYDIRKILGEYEVKALPGLLHAAEAWPQTVLVELGHVDSTRVAAPMADALVRMKKVGPVARAWLGAFPETASIALVPPALGKVGKERDAAEVALRWLAEHGKRDAVTSAAASYGAKASAALEEILAFDALDDLPAKIPTAPAWLDVATLPSPKVAKGDKVLPPRALAHVVTMLSISTLEAPYAGLALVKAACEPRSLAELAWDVFLAWSLAGHPSKDDWALAAIGLFGDDECARRLASRVREWPGEGGHTRATRGLDVLAALGSDIALMHLDAIATKVKFKGLQEKARERISAVAEARGLSRDELSDRLVPDLELDEDGSRALSFGARTFRVAWDEQLVPFVTEAGTRLKDLPKPLKTDDAALAKEATTAWKALKKDAKAIASHQLMRLERAMCARRRWDEGTFRTFFVAHPLVVHVVRRLVFGVYDGAELVTTFRVGEDRALSDAKDRPLGVQGLVGIVHRLELDEAARLAWSELLAQYEIIPPFPQLDRETFSLTEAEKKAHATKRFEGTAVPLGKVLGLEARGWRRGMPQDAGWIWDMQKPLGDGRLALLGLGGGILAGDMRESPAEQKLEALSLVEEDSHKEGPKLGDLDAVSASELLRDVALLVGERP